MVNKRALSNTLDNTWKINDANPMIEMHAAMDELHHRNQTLEDNIFNIRQGQL